MLCLNLNEINKLTKFPHNTHLGLLLSLRPSRVLLARLPTLPRLLPPFVVPKWSPLPTLGDLRVTVDSWNESIDDELSLVSLEKSKIK